MIEIMAKYGYAGLFFSLLADQLGFPMPSMLLVMAAGALAGLGELNLLTLFILVLIANMIGDFAWFEIGRRRGMRVLGFLCKFSLEKDSCVRNTQDKFLKRGDKTLLFAKFIPGLATIAPPLAGIVGISPGRFFIFNTLGTIAWTAAFLGTGFLFKNQFEQIADKISEFGTGLLTFGVVVLILFAAIKYIIRRRFLRKIFSARISIEELKQKIDDGEDFIIADLRHELDFNSDPRIIPGAIRFTTDDIDSRHHELPRNKEIVLYCSCPNEATSASIALMLHKKGVKNVRPLAGGFPAWVELNYPFEKYPITQ